MMGMGEVVKEQIKEHIVRSHILILKTLSTYGRCREIEISKDTGLSPATIHVMLNKLLMLGLVRKDAHHYELTGEGREYLRKCVEDLRKLVEGLQEVV